MQKKEPAGYLYLYGVSVPYFLVDYKFFKDNITKIFQNSIINYHTTPLWTTYTTLDIKGLELKAGTMEKAKFIEWLDKWKNESLSTQREHNFGIEMTLTGLLATGTVERSCATVEQLFGLSNTESLVEDIL